MLTAMIVIAVIALLLLLPVVINAEYNTLGLEVSVRCAIFRFKIRPNVGKAKKADRKRRIKEKIKCWSFEKLHKLVKIALKALERLKKHIRIESLRVKFISADADPSTAAMRYAAVNSAAAAVIYHLEQSFRIKSREVSISTDYEAEKDSLELGISLSLRLLQALYTLLHLLLAAKAEQIRSAFRSKHERKSERGQQAERFDA